MAYLTSVALRSRDSQSSSERGVGTVAIQSVAVIALLSVGYSAFLAFVSTVWIRSYCLYCISLYIVNIAALLLALRASQTSLPAAIGASLRALFGMKAPVPVAAAILIASAGVALGGYGQARNSMEASAKRAIDQRFAEQATPAATDKTETTTSATEVSALSPPQPAPQLQSSARGTRGGKKTADGYTYFEAPIDESSEFWAGNPDAKVTVVKYADFQCAYCRMLAQSLHTVEEERGDRVRFVMKHFPMNIKCNRAMAGFDKHQVACEAAYAAHCAGKQGKFWEMHDLLYQNQPSLSLEKLTELSQELELDSQAFAACMDDPATHQKIRDDVESGLYAGIYGTPRTYINNRLVTGSAHAAIIDYYIDKAFEELETGSVASSDKPLAPKPDGRNMIAAKTTAATFYIDAYEAAITKDGRAVSQPGLTPAQADYYSAKEACEKSGKRLCSEEEWVSACTGEPAVDNNSNKMFADDLVEGDMYPYGAYHEENRCQDRADKHSGTAVLTGSLAQCRTASGLFDLAGNIAEWADADNGKPTLLGGSMSSATGAACNTRTFSTPPGSRNRTTGFRCCADTNVASTPVAADQIQANLEDILNMAVPAFAVDDTEGNTINSADFKGKVTLLSFFASWCGPCKKEFPHLIDYADRFRDKGLQIVGVGVDTLAQRSIDFANGFDVNFPVITDTDARLKGKFIVYEMPATFLIDRQGVIRYRATGFSGAEQEAELRSEIEKLL